MIFNSKEEKVSVLVNVRKISDKIPSFHPRVQLDIYADVIKFPKAIPEMLHGAEMWSQ